MSEKDDGGNSPDRLKLERKGYRCMTIADSMYPELDQEEKVAKAIEMMGSSEEELLRLEFISGVRP